MLRSKNDENPASFEDGLFFSTPLPHYHKVTCNSLVVPPDILILDDQCLYVVLVSLRDVTTNAIRGNKIICIPNNLTLHDDVSSLVDLMNSPLYKWTFKEIIDKSSLIHSSHHLRLFLNVIEFIKYINIDHSHVTLLHELEDMNSGVKNYNESRANDVCRQLKDYVYNKNWYDLYETNVNFDLKQYVQFSFNEFTHKFYFPYVGNDTNEVIFKILPYETYIQSNIANFNKLKSWLGTEENTWKCSRNNILHIMPLLSHLHDKFVFFKIYLSIVTRNVVVGSDMYYDKLLAIIDRKKSSHYNLKHFWVDLSPYSDFLKCRCIIKNAWNEIVHFAKSPQGTTVVLHFQ